MSIWSKAAAVVEVDRRRSSCDVPVYQMFSDVPVSPTQELRASHDVCNILIALHDVCITRLLDPIGEGLR
ncbi:hypothetical protein Ancab_031103, partial [Ancistrocladus abbreviatus]